MIKAIILCAGRGGRLRPLTDKVPKPLVKVGGKPIIWYIENLLEQHFGPVRIGVNLHWLPSQIIDYFDKRVLYSYEPELLGTAGALVKFKGCLYDPFLVLNGDTISDVDLTDMVSLAYDTENIATIFTHDTAVHNGGAFIFRKKIFDYIPSGSYSIHEDLLPDLIKKKIPISLYRSSSACYFDCGTPEKLKKAREFFK